jgi:hypothetical protein
MFVFRRDNHIAFPSNFLLVGDTTELLRRPYCYPKAVLLERRVTAFALSMLKMRDANAMLRRCWRDVCDLTALTSAF